MLRVEKVDHLYYCFQNKVYTGHSGELPIIPTFFFTENENDSRGEIIGEWLKIPPSGCPYFTPNITLLTVDYPKIRAIFSQLCMLDSRVESK